MAPFGSLLYLIILHFGLFLFYLLIHWYMASF
jgi:hypothetical protein